MCGMTQHAAEDIVRRATAPFQDWRGIVSRDMVGGWAVKLLLLMSFPVPERPSMTDSRIGRSDSGPKSLEIARVPGAQWHFQ